MIRAGSLRHTITIEREWSDVMPIADPLNAAGTPIHCWRHHATLQAESIDLSIDEHAQRFGDATHTSYVFRTRYFGDVKLSDRVTYLGHAFNIKRLTFDDRRRWTELSILRVGS